MADYRLINSPFRQTEDSIFFCFFYLCIHLFIYFALFFILYHHLLYLFCCCCCILICTMLMCMCSQISLPLSVTMSQVVARDV